MFWFCGAAVAAPIVDNGTLGVIGSKDSSTDDVVVLALKGNTVAFRRVVRGESEDAVSCGYDGVKDPTGGIELGLYDLSLKKTTESWWIYKPATDQADCTPRATSEANLAKAKARFAALGLDISNPPPPLDLAAAGLRAGPPTKPAADETDDPNLRTGELSLFRGSTELYHRYVTYSSIAGVVVGLEFLHAWRAGDVLLVLQCDHIGGTSGDGRTCSLLRF